MTRREFEAVTRRFGLVWHTPPENQGQIVILRYAEDDGRYWKAVEDTSLRPSDPARVEVYRADATDPRDVLELDPFEPWLRAPRGIRWHRVAEAEA